MNITELKTVRFKGIDGKVKYVKGYEFDINDSMLTVDGIKYQYIELIPNYTRGG